MADVNANEVIDPKLFEIQIINATKLIKAMEEMEKQFSSIISKSAELSRNVNFSAFDQLTNAEKGIQDAQKAWEGYNQVLEDKAKLERELAALKAQFIASQVSAEAKAEAARARQAAKELERIKKEQEAKARRDKREQEAADKKAQKQRQLTDDEIKAEIIRKRQHDARMKQLKDEAILLDAQAGELEKLAAKNRMLARERDSMSDIYSDEAKDKIKAINDEINANNKIIEENADKLKQQKMNVGNYTDSILSALNSTNSFGSSIEGLSAITLKFSPAIGLLTAGIEKYTAWLEKAKGESEKTGKEVTRTGKIFRGIKIGIGSLAIGAAGGIATAFASTRSGGEVLQATLKKLEMSFGLIANAALVKFNLIDVSKLGNELDQVISKRRELQELREDYKKIKFFVSDDDEILKEFNRKIDELLKKEIELDEKGMKPLIDRSKDLWEQLVDIFTGPTSDAIDAYAKSMNDLQTLTGDYAIQLAKLGANVAYLDMIEGDNTESLEKRAAAMKKAGEETVKMARLQKELNDGTLKTTATNLFLSDSINSNKILERYGVTATNASTKIRELYENNKAFRDELMAGADPARLNEFQNSLASLYTAEGEYSAKVRDLQNKKRQADQDSLEIDLDITQDTYDKKLTLWEAEIAKLEVSNAKKQELYELANAQAKATMDKTAQILTDPKLAGSQNKEAILKLFEIQDLETLRVEIRKLEKSEMIETRVRQYIEDYADNLQRIADLNQQILQEQGRIKTLQSDTTDLKAQAEELKNLREIQELKAGWGDKTLTKEEMEAEVLAISEKYEQKAIDNKRAALEEELKLVELTSEREAQIKKELAEMELEAERKKTEDAKKELDKRNENTKKAAEKDAEELKRKAESEKETMAAVDAFMNAYFDSANKKREESYQKELASGEKREARLQELADKGVEGAGESLEKQARRNEEIKAKAAKEAKVQAALQTFVALLTAYGQRLASGDKAALANTLKDGLALKTGAKAIASFDVGTDNTGNWTDRGLDGKGGHIALIHPNERIFNSAHTTALGKATNEEIVQKVNEAKFLKAQNSELAVKISELTNTVKNKAEYLGADIDVIADAVAQRIKKGNAVTTRLSRNNPLS